MDQRLKERLIGAVVLVALAVWLIPWLLDGPERETVAETVALELPAAEESAPVKTVTVDLDDRDRPGAQAGNAAGRDERARAAPESGPAFGDASDAPGDTAVASEQVPAADPERVPVAEADAEVAGTRAASAREAGSSADAGAGEPGREAAEAAVEKTGEARDADSEAAEAAVGNAGGEGAEAAVDEAGTEPAAAGSVPAGTVPAGDWAVQLGSFGEIANAERLAARVETFGYEPEVSTHTAGGRELHRVRVGPQPSRARAEAVVSALTAHGFVAQVVTAD